MTYTRNLLLTNYLNLSLIFSNKIRRKARIIDFVFFGIWAVFAICLCSVTIPADIVQSVSKKVVKN